MPGSHEDPRPDRSPGAPVEQPADLGPLSLLAFTNAGNGFAEQRVERRPDEVHNARLAQRLDLDSPVPTLGPPVDLPDRFDAALLNKLFGHPQPRPLNDAARLAFENPPGIRLDVGARLVAVAEVEDGTAVLDEQRRDLGNQEAAGLALCAGDRAAVVGSHGVGEHAGRRLDSDMMSGGSRSPHGFTRASSSRSRT